MTSACPSRVWDAMMELRAYLFENVYFSERAKAEEPKAHAVVQALFEHYLADTGRSARRRAPG